MSPARCPPSGQRAPVQRLTGDFQEQIESLDQEAERHDRDRGANPGQEGPLVRGVIAVPLYHRHSRVYGRRRDGPCPTNDGAYRYRRHLR